MSTLIGTAKSVKIAPQAKKRSELAQAASKMQEKLRSSNIWLTRFYEDGTISKIPNSIRGNKTYAYYQNIRIAAIQEIISAGVQSTPETTNALFLTLTQQYNPSSVTSVRGTWESMQKALPKFKTRLRRLGMVKFVATLEAHAAGGCHCHLVGIFKSDLPVKEIGGKRRLGSQDLLWKIKVSWAKSLGRTLDEAFIDVIAADEDAAGYVMKELKKVNSCEESLKRFSAGTATSDDAKRIFAFYFADKYRMRLLQTSRGLVVPAEPEEGTVPSSEETDLISNVISRTFIEVVVTKRQLFEHGLYYDISPYTGIVDRNSREYAVLLDIMANYYPDNELIKRLRVGLKGRSPPEDLR
jgi:hypothetical protein